MLFAAGMDAVKSDLYQIYSTVAVGLKSSKSFWKQPALFYSLLSVALSEKDEMHLKKGHGQGRPCERRASLQNHLYDAPCTPGVPP